MHSNQEPRSKLDSHAYNCCIGNNALVINYHNQIVSVAPFLDPLGTEHEVPIITAAIAYDGLILAQAFILIVHQALYFGDKLSHNLVNPFQCRLNKVQINECPQVLTNRPDDMAHSIIFHKEQVKIPLRLHGIVSYFPSGQPTMQEYEGCIHLHLTPEDPEWRCPHTCTLIDLGGNRDPMCVTKRSSHVSDLVRTSRWGVMYYRYYRSSIATSAPLPACWVLELHGELGRRGVSMVRAGIPTPTAILQVA
jgi:hypothetical protein